MTSHLPSAVSDLLEAGLTSEEMASLMGIDAANVSRAVKAEEPSGLTFGGAIRLGKLTYLLHELRRNMNDAAERLQILQEEAAKIGGKDEKERFGVSLDLIRAIIAEHKGMIRFGCYVAIIYLTYYRLVGHKDRTGSKSDVRSNQSDLS